MPLRRVVADVIGSSGPIRTLAVAGLVNTFGRGLSVTIVVVYFTRDVGLSAGQVGLALTVGGLLGLLVGVPVGEAADRRGPREWQIALSALQGVAALSYLFVRSFPAFLAAACVVTLLDRASSAVRQGLIARALAPENRVRGRAVLRVVTNLGIGLGSLVGGLGLALDSHAGYLALLTGDAVTFGLAALLLRRLAPVAPAPAKASSGPRYVVLRDRPYLLITGLIAAGNVQFAILEVGVPLWVTGHTSAPRVLVAVLLVINCAGVALFQVRAARGSEDVAVGARASARAGLVLAMACVLFEAAGLGAALIASVVLVLAEIVHVAGELQQSAGQFSLSYGLAPEALQGQYQGLAATGMGVASALGPGVMTLVVSAGTGGWLGLGAVFALTGAAVVPATRWAARSRPDTANSPA